MGRREMNSKIRALLNGGEQNGRCNTCVARACAHARHTDDTHAFPQSTLFVVSKSRLVASLARRLHVTEKNVPPPFRSPPFESARKMVVVVVGPSLIYCERSERMCDRFRLFFGNLMCDRNGIVPT